MKTEILARLIRVNQLANETDDTIYTVEWSDEWVQHFARLIIRAVKDELIKELISD